MINSKLLCSIFVTCISYFSSTRYEESGYIQTIFLYKNCKLCGDSAYIQYRCLSIGSLTDRGTGSFIYLSTGVRERNSATIDAC